MFQLFVRCPPFLKEITESANGIHESVKKGERTTTEFVVTVQRLPGNIVIVYGRNNLDCGVSLKSMLWEKATFCWGKAVPIALLPDIRKDIAKRT